MAEIKDTTKRKIEKETITSYKAYLRKYAPKKYADEYEDIRTVPRLTIKRD